MFIHNFIRVPRSFNQDAALERVRILLSVTDQVRTDPAIQLMLVLTQIEEILLTSTPY